MYLCLYISMSLCLYIYLYPYISIYVGSKQSTLHTQPFHSVLIDPTPRPPHTEAEFALCMIGKKWCAIEHFDPKGTQCVRESMWLDKQPCTTRYTKLQRGCRRCTAYHSKVCKKSLARIKQRKADTNPVQTTAADATVTQTEPNETSYIGIAPPGDV